jgi:flagellar biosynthesis anti-sigma factor FlgM
VTPANELPLKEKYPQRDLPGAQSAVNTGAELMASASTLSASSDNPKSQGPDKVAHSSDAGKLSNLRAKLNGVPEIREDRVATLSAAIKNGTFLVTNKQIAQAFLRDFQGGHTFRG